MTLVDRIRGETFHGRKGVVKNAFRYSVEYLLLDMDRSRGRGLFSRNARNLLSVHDSDHGGAPGEGRGTQWVREVLAEAGLARADVDGPHLDASHPDASRLDGAHKILLLAQPRVMGHVFNPVSFWLCHDQLGHLRAAIAEVTNTYGDRHSYLCHRPDNAPITREDTLVARKIFHVSPFQPVEGRYSFRFDIRSDRIGIWIDYTSASGGVFTNLIGPREPLTTLGALAASFRRPFGSRRVLALIHWQALKLFLKRVQFYNRPVPPREDVS